MAIDRSLTVCMLGAGAVADALGGVLAREGAELRLWARRSRRAAALRNGILAVARGSARRVRVEPDLRTALIDADLVLFCVSDRAVESLAREVAALWTPGRRRAVAAHTAGFHAPSALRSLTRHGFAIGSLHPLVTLPDPAARNAPRGVDTLQGAWFRIEGEPRARTLLRRLMRAVAGRELRVGSQDAARYHAAAALLSNGTVALFDAALEVLEGAGSARRSARSALAGLLASTAAQLERRDPVAALTGPAARGDVDVVAGHLRALEDQSGGVQTIYRALTARMLDLAAARGTLHADALGELEQLLAE